MRELPWATRLYISAVVAAGVVVVLACVLRLHATWESLGPVLALALLVVGAEQVKSWLVRSVATRNAVSISVTMPVAIASVLLLGPWGAPLVGAVVALDLSIAWYKRLFNGAMDVLTAFCAGFVFVELYSLTSGIPAPAGGMPLGLIDLHNAGYPLHATALLLPMLAATLTYELVNGALMVTVIALAEKVSPWRVWIGTMAESALPLFIYSTFGLLLAIMWLVGPFAAVLVLAPLMVARWVFAQFAARQEAYEATMRSLIQAVETKDLYTRGHSERVSRASVLIGRASGMREDRVTTLRYAGTLHDVGKLGVPTRVLQKAGKLTDEEYEAIQQHPSRGREITKDLEFLGEAIEGIHFHHERIDGRGYPLGLKGSEIPEFARIIAVADAYDSMTTTRSYRGARSIEDAVVELRRCKGSQFDPIMVEALVQAIETHGWDVTDTLPEIAMQPSDSSLPAFGTDDDDPTARATLALHVPDDASEIDDINENAGDGK